MFKIRGTDQKEYGPVTTDVLRQWITDRRVDARTLIQAEGTDAWKPLADFPEFAPALAAMRPPTMTPPASSAGPSQTSGLAVASLVTGIFGCLGITGIAGIIMGAIALRRINQSQGRLKGTPLAITGMCLSAFMLFLALPIGAGLLLPALAKAKGRAQTINCQNNMKQLALGCLMYAADNKDMLPAAQSWCDDIGQNLTGPTVFRCPAASGTPQSTYAINARVAGRKTDEANPRAVLLFEIEGGWNVAGGPELLLKGSRHGSVVTVAFVDGSVMRVPVQQASTFRWDP